MIQNENLQKTTNKITHTHTKKNPTHTQQKKSLYLFIMGKKERFFFNVLNDTKTTNSHLPQNPKQSKKTTTTTRRITTTKKTHPKNKPNQKNKQTQNPHNIFICHKENIILKIIYLLTFCTAPSSSTWSLAVTRMWIPPHPSSSSTRSMAVWSGTRLNSLTSTPTATNRSMSPSTSPHRLARTPPTSAGGSRHTMERTRKTGP